MLEDDLQIGDVIFFVDNQGVPLHVAIYNGKRADTHFISHATSDPYNAIMTTRLKKDDFPYRVFRPTNFQLAVQTALRLRMWAEHQVPYSHEKGDILDAILDMPDMSHPQTGAQAQSALAQSHFAPNFYRYIEYAAHSNMPFYPDADSQEGMSCSEALVAAFNVENLTMINAVNSCQESGCFWVSDHADPLVAKPFLENLPLVSQDYLNYCKRIHSAQEYPFVATTLHRGEAVRAQPPAIITWNYHLYGPVESFLQQYNFSLPLDSKISTPQAMMYYFQSHPEHWQALSDLTVEEKIYPLAQLETNKEAWRTYVKDLFKEAENKQQQIRILGASPIASPSSLENKSLSKRAFSYDSFAEIATVYDPHDVALDQQSKQAVIFTTPPKASKRNPRFGTTSEKIPVAKRLFSSADETALMDDAERTVSSNPKPFLSFNRH